jgi:nitrogen regulation protein NR(I)
MSELLSELFCPELFTLMNHLKNSVLIIDDDPGIRSAMREVLESDGFSVAIEADGQRGLALALANAFSIVICDLKLPGMDGLEVIRELHQTKPHLPIILMTAHGTTETAIEAMKIGAYDYIVKPFEMPDFLSLLEKASRVAHLMSGPVIFGRAEQGKEALVGRSRLMQNVYKEIGRVATRPVTVLIRGETGTGKELVARAIYQHSDRARGPFIALNCAAIPETLLESELFGHERGAFTGAENRRIGRFEQATGGTIFLDEIGDISLGTQVKLLRVLQDRTIQRLGGKEIIPVDVRVIAATHRDLEVAIKKGEFRQDLFYRLNVFQIALPALRDRREDIPDLVQYFLGKFASDSGMTDPSIRPEVLTILEQQSWPGNVRELENAVRKLLVQARGLTITLEDLKTVLPVKTTPIDSNSLEALVRNIMARAASGQTENAYNELIELAERELLQQSMRLANDNQSKVSRWLGISRLTLREKLSRHGLHPNRQLQ